MTFEGRKILITGAASGIGLAAAANFAQAGASVGLVDRDRERLAAAVAQVGERSVAHVADVAREAEVDAAVGTIAAALGGIDGVVNCAGVDFIKPFMEMETADWNRIMAVNVNGPFHICKAALPHLRRAEAGTIVNIASAAGLRPLEQRTAYCASKAALVMFTKTLATEIFADGVRANVICPGIVETPLFEASYRNAPDPEAELKRIMDRYVIKRPGTPDEIASAILFLSGPNSSYVTGSALAVDGGRSFH